jgi:uncharacterized protein
MPKRLIKRFLPDHRKFRDHQQLKRFGARLHDPNLWHLSRRSVPGAFAIGLFIAFIPVPFQMIIAAAIAIIARVNLPISVALVWVTNPLTMPAIFYFSYKVGARLLGERIQPIAFEPSLRWLLTETHTIWAPLLLGSLICGAVSAVLGYFTIRSLWRLQVVKNWQARKLRPQKPANGKVNE